MAKSPEIIVGTFPTVESSSPIIRSGELNNIQIGSTLVLCFCGKSCQIIANGSYLNQCRDCMEMSLKQRLSGFLYEKEGWLLKRYWLTFIKPYLFSKCFFNILEYESKSKNMVTFVFYNN